MTEKRRVHGRREERELNRRKREGGTDDQKRGKEEEGREVSESEKELMSKSISLGLILTHAATKADHAVLGTGSKVRYVGQTTLYTSDCNWVRAVRLLAISSCHCAVCV